jgi:hypothetical protein
MNSETKRPIPLGAWNLSEVTRISPRKGYFDKSNSTIYIPTQKVSYNSYKTFDISRTSGGFYERNSTEQAEVSEGAVPADIFNQTESVTFQYSSIAPKPFYHQQEDYSQWSTEILRNLIIEDKQELRNSLTDPISRVNIVSDGGIHNYQSNYGLVLAIKSYSLATNMRKKYIGFPSTNHYLAQNLFGMLAPVKTLWHIIDFYKITLPIIHYTLKSLFNLFLTCRYQRLGRPNPSREC